MARAMYVTLPHSVTARFRIKIGARFTMRMTVRVGVGAQRRAPARTLKLLLSGGFGGW